MPHRSVAGGRSQLPHLAPAGHTGQWATQPAVPLPPHRLVWLEPRSAAVSGNRGWAERIGAGSYCGCLPEAKDAEVNLEISDGPLAGRLQINRQGCQLTRP